ncbi:uncharacterized protein LOC142776875 [Rhipicephalus microplus]|uniref:uncharacterized protein LOC142776875 n=1 Tax=Rhipicephalus microplus TaxID=6941 RepID=UPI003F6AB27B
MSHASRFCISQALVTLLLLPFSPTILTATDNPVPLPPLSQPSDDRNQEHGFFFAWPDMVHRDSSAAPSSVTSLVPGAYLNSYWHDYRFSGQAGSAGIMFHASRFCISQELVKRLHDYASSRKRRAPVSYQVLTCVYIEPTRSTKAAITKGRLGRRK